MKNKPVITVFLIVVMFNMTNAHADDFCDEAFVSNLLIALESDDDFQSCNLESIKKTNRNTALEIIELLTTLKNSSLAAIETEDMVDTLDLAGPTSKIQDIEDIDLDTEAGLDQLSKWATDVHSALKPPKKSIMKLKPDPTSNEEKQERCEVKYRWRKLHALRNQILSCVDKAKAEQPGTEAVEEVVNDRE